MNYIRINPIDYPLDKGESWWICHPNNQNSEFKIPRGAVTLCTQDFLDFTAGKTYKVLDDDPDNGWLTVTGKALTVRMPYYVFARNFDAECFVRGRFSIEGKKVVPFDYKSTTKLPKHLKNMEVMED